MAIWWLWPGDANLSLIGRIDKLLGGNLQVVSGGETDYWWLRLKELVGTNLVG